MSSEIVLQDMKEFVVSACVHHLGVGQQMVMRFPNEYGASIVRAPHSCGGEQGKYKLAVISWHGDDWSLCYDTPITDDVLGYLSAKEVIGTLTEIMALPSAGGEEKE